ncbi:MAG: hypothetical protein JSW46_10785 [Gemmatimonadota bacterium]|nr:MAG: hypothetical protein JSW46_10785 [Gemmatimonadota bacterium]
MRRKVTYITLFVTPSLALAAAGCGASVTDPDGSQPPPGIASVAISGGPAAPRQGDVVGFVAEISDTAGAPVDGATASWSVLPSSAGAITAAGRFVGYTPGTARIVASVGRLADTLTISITERGAGSGRGPNARFEVVGSGSATRRYTSDLWVHGSFAYTGTWECRAGLCGDRMHVWDITAPSTPALVESVIVDAVVVNDVKVRDDGTIAVITHEGSSDGLNGVTLLGLSDPAKPNVITRFTSELQSGVHNVWIDGNYVYAAVDGFGNGLRIIDISDPSAPRVVGRYFAGSSFLHDVYVRAGLAFLSHWDAGLVILDVGNGISGGSPSNPIEVSRIQTAGGQTHNAWYWPAAGYVFVGEEDFQAPGLVHVVDASDLENPTEVATFRVSGATPHNFWVDEEGAILYAAWYENGLRALDVSGELLGELDRQGREIANIKYGSGTGCVSSTETCTWAPQLHEGLVYLSDMNTGLWVLRPNF